MQGQSGTQEAILGAITILVIAATFYFDSWWPLAGVFLLLAAAIVIFAVRYQRSLDRDRRQGNNQEKGDSSGRT